MTYQPYEPGGSGSETPETSEPKGQRAAPYGSADGRPPASDVRLVEPPRPVPLSYRIASMSLGPTPLFVLYVGGVSCLALWLLSPLARLLGVLTGIAVLGGWCWWRYRRFVPVLRNGEVARIVSVERTAGMSSYENWPVRRARGWLGRWEFYSGSGSTNVIDFTVGGAEGTITVRGAPYDGGIILADPRDPTRSLCVSQLPFSLTPGPDGRFADPVPISGWVVTTLTLAPLVALVLALAWLALR